MDLSPPRSTPVLLKALRSAACYAELVQLTSSWEPYEIEFQVYGRKHTGQDHRKSRATFYPTRNGSVPTPARINDVEKRFPHTRIRWWRQHPIAEILCDSGLEQDGILKALATCATGKERELMWDERFVGMLSGERFHIEVPDSHETIYTLVRIGSIESLLILVGRMRLAQLRGLADFDTAYETAIWQVLPTCIARSPHLLLGCDALLSALNAFLAWSPFSDNRFFDQIMSNGAADLRRSFESRLKSELDRLEVKAPPEEHLMIRRALL